MKTMRTIKLIMMTLALTTILSSCGESEEERLERESMERVDELMRQSDSISNYYEKYQDSIQYQNKIDEINAEYELELVKVKNKVQ